MANYKEGRWPGKLVDYGIGETKAGEPQVELVFEVAFDTGAANMKYRGSLKSEKAQEITFKALQALGFTGRINDLLDGPEGGALTIGAPASLVIQNEPYTGDDGKTRDSYKIQWVNAPGGGGAQVKRADAAAAKAKLLQLGVDGAWAKFKQLNPGAPAPKAPAPAAAGNDDDIPF